MLKPNIRGYPKAQLRFSLLGWRLKSNPQCMILHRFPWDKSWIKQMERNPEAQAIFSRLGRTHVVVELKNKSERFNPKIMLGAVLSVVFTALLITAQLEPALVREVASTRQAQTSQLAKGAKSACPVSDSDYSGKISDWLSKRNIAPVKISQESQIEIGGIRSSVLLIGCQLIQQRVRLTEVKQEGTWKIKETAQLAN
ncbi:MAG: hypothetical protein F2624_00460 [Actinobacteria bacterium]|nr:hypothetical protein [Actinomycetota bacterium]